MNSELKRGAESVVDMFAERYDQFCVRTRLYGCLN
jgi:hypothetical protein